MKRVIYSAMALTLLAFAIASFTIKSEPLLPTSLRVTVLNALGNVVKGASVALYKSEADYFNDKDPVTPVLKTDAKGRVTFKKLKPIKYFIFAKKGEKDNTGQGVSTGKLKEGRRNLVNTIIK